MRSRVQHNRWLALTLRRRDRGRRLLLLVSGIFLGQVFARDI